LKYFCAGVYGGDFAVNTTPSIISTSSREGHFGVWGAGEEAGNVRWISSPEIGASTDYFVAGVVDDDGAVCGERTGAGLFEEGFVGLVLMLVTDLEIDEEQDGNYKAHVFDAGSVWDTIYDYVGHVLVIIRDDEVCCCCSG
jgi:hypothetical protein